MAIPHSTLSPADRTILALRGLLVGVTLALAGMEPALRARLLIVAGVGLLLILAGLGLRRRADARPLPGAINLALDSAFALLLYWASGGMAAALFAAGTLPVAAAALEGRWLRGAALALSLAALAGLLTALLPLPAAGSLPEFLFASGALLLVGVLVSAAAPDSAAPAARDAEAARERARVLYEMAAKLNAKLDGSAVLAAILDVGALGLRELDAGGRLVSAVLLCDKERGRMRVASARRLPPTDLEREVACRSGALAQAVHQAEPILIADARNDPELQPFTGFADCRSLVCVPLHSGDSSDGVLVFGSTQADAFGPDRVALLTAIANQAAIALQNARLFENLVAEKERLLQVEDDARKQLSRELHDGPTQSVAAIAMRVNYIRRLLDRQPDQVPPELQRVEELARQTSREIRHMLFTLRPLVLETRGLVPALEELATKLGETYGQQVLVQVQPGVDSFISPDDQNLIFNIVDEAVNNARKHAEAEHIWVRLNRQDRYLILDVQDDGVGFDVGEVDANYDQRGSLGMINLRERAELLGGTLEIESAEGRGTRVTLTVQIDPERLQIADAEAAISDQQSAVS